MLFIDQTSEYEKKLIAMQNETSTDDELFSGFYTDTTYNEILCTRVEKIISERINDVDGDIFRLFDAWLDHLYREYNIPAAECETGTILYMRGVDQTCNLLRNMNLDDLVHEYREVLRKCIEEQDQADAAKKQETSSVRSKIVKFPIR